MDPQLRALNSPGNGASLLALGSDCRRRRVLFGGIIGLCAVAAGMPVRADTIASTGAVETIRAFETTLLTIMKASSSTPIVRRFDILAPVVDRTFDLQTILRNSVGLKWSGLSAAERSALLTTFRRYTIASWVVSFNAWSGQQFTVSTGLRHVVQDVVVRTELVPPAGTPTNLSYVMRQQASGWKVVDALADGSISRVAVQRSDFRGLLARGGVPALIAGLRQKINGLSDGSLA